MLMLIMLYVNMLIILHYYIILILYYYIIASEEGICRSVMHNAKLIF